MRKLALSDEELLSVERPARYIGGEMNSACKIIDGNMLRFVMCFPDVYEIGMSKVWNSRTSSSSGQSTARGARKSARARG